MTTDSHCSLRLVILNKPAKLHPLTSLRFFAAFIVVLGHCYSYFPMGADFFLLFPAYHGVTFFFVLSGFILSYVYPTLSTKVEIKRFFVARFGRLWPLHFVTFLIAILLLDDVREAIISSEGIWLAIMNLSLTHSFIPLLAYQFSYNSVSWSISAELFFYICFIGITFFRRSPWLILALVGIGPLFMITLSIILNLPLYDPDEYSLSQATLIYIHPLTRIFDFVIGFVAGKLFTKYRSSLEVINKHWTNVLEIFAVCLLAFSLYLTYAFWLEYFPFFHGAILLWLDRSGPSILYAFIIVVFALNAGLISRFLSLPILVLLGTSSIKYY